MTDLELSYINKAIENIAENTIDISTIAEKLDNVDERLSDLVDAINNLADIIDHE